MSSHKQPIAVIRYKNKQAIYFLIPCRWQPQNCQNLHLWHLFVALLSFLHESQFGSNEKSVKLSPHPLRLQSNLNLLQISTTVSIVVLCGKVLNLNLNGLQVNLTSPKSAPLTRTVAPACLHAVTFIIGAIIGITTYAGMPRSLAWYARARAWFPADAAITPFSFWS